MPFEIDLHDRRVWIFSAGGLAAILAVVGVSWLLVNDAASSRQRSATAGLTKAGAVPPLGSLVFSIEGQTVAVLPEAGNWTEQAGRGAVENDPFQIHVVQEARASAPVPSGLIVSAVLTGGDQNVAIINNEPVAVGDIVAGLPVVEIQLDRVVLGRGPSRRVLPVE